MSDDDAVYVGHMLDAARKARSLVGARDRAAYDNDETLRLALAHLVQTIGEAARRVSRELLESQPHIPWSEIMGMRHKIVHDYMDLEEDVLWSVVTTDLPGLIQDLERFLLMDGGE